MVAYSSYGLAQFCDVPSRAKKNKEYKYYRNCVECDVYFGTNRINKMTCSDDCSIDWMSKQGVRKTQKKKLMNIERAQRVENVNKLIEVIATCGRKFFGHEGRVSKMEVDVRGRVWFTDAYNNKRIYIHNQGRWRGFTGGGTLKSLVESLKNYISHNKQLWPLAFGPWKQCVCDGDLWGYGDDMDKVRKAAFDLGIIKEIGTLKEDNDGDT